MLFLYKPSELPNADEVKYFPRTDSSQSFVEITTKNAEVIRYVDICRELGRGGEAIVREFRGDGGCVAVMQPILEGDDASQEQYCRVFEEKMEVTKKVFGDEFVHVFADSKNYRAVTVVYEGEILSKHLVRCPWEPISNVVHAVALGLQMFHKKGFFHGDLKEDNVFIVPEIDGFSLSGLISWLIDYGFSCQFGQPVEKIPFDHAPWECPTYWAPERFTNIDETLLANPSIDVYALGDMFLRLFADSIQKTIFYDWCQRAKSEDPAQRPVLEELITLSGNRLEEIRALEPDEKRLQDYLDELMTMPASDEMRDKITYIENVLEVIEGLRFGAAGIDVNMAAISNAVFKWSDSLESSTAPTTVNFYRKGHALEEFIRSDENIFPLSASASPRPRC